MTRGRVILGRTGEICGRNERRNCIRPESEGDFAERCNLDMVELETFEDAKEEHLVHSLIEEHSRLTGSIRAREIVDEWSRYREIMVKVMPIEYRKVLEKSGAISPQLKSKKKYG
jgi:glutamate synthase (NADPH/NADH) large chain